MSRDVADDWYYLRVIERPLLATNGWVSGLFLRCKFGTQLGNKAASEEATARKRKPSTGREIRLKVATTPLAGYILATHTWNVSSKRDTLCTHASIVFLLRSKYIYFYTLYRQFSDTALLSNVLVVILAILIFQRYCHRWSINDRPPAIICQINSHKSQKRKIAER